MPNPYAEALGRTPRKKEIGSSHKRSKVQEKEIATRLGGSLTLASGAKGEKGDVRRRKLVRIECKTTQNKSFSVTVDMVRKIEEAALSAGEMPALLIEFNDGAGKRIMEVAVVPSYVLEQLCEIER